MGWILEISKMLVVVVLTIFVLLVGYMLPPHQSKATGLDLLFHLMGSRLALVGVLNVVIGLVLTRLSVVGDAAGRWHFSLR